MGYHTNKIDLTTDELLREVTESLNRFYGFRVIEISSRTGDKLDTLLEAVNDVIAELK